MNSATPYHLNLEKQSQTLAKAYKETMRPPWPFGTNQFFGYKSNFKKISLCTIFTKKIFESYIEHNLVIRIPESWPDIGLTLLDEINALICFSLFGTNLCTNDLRTPSQCKKELIYAYYLIHSQH